MSFKETTLMPTGLLASQPGSSHLRIVSLWLKGFVFLLGPSVNHVNKYLGFFDTSPPFYIIRLGS